MGLNTIRIAIRQSDMAGLLCLFEGLSTVEGVQLLLPVLSGVCDGPVSSFLSVSAGPGDTGRSKAANKGFYLFAWTRFRASPFFRCLGLRRGGASEFFFVCLLVSVYWGRWYFALDIYSLGCSSWRWGPA